MHKTKVLITVTTYPLPSRSHDELVCTAGILENGEWVRIYPIPFSFWGFHKYEWVKLGLTPRDRNQDFRPESYRPVEYDLSDLEVIEKVSTSQGWYSRKELCLKNVYYNLTKLIEDSKAPKNLSLAAFTPSKIKKFIVEEDSREWKSDWIAKAKQTDFFAQAKNASSDIFIEKIPYKFKYMIEDDEGRNSTMTIEDWEIGALYRSCLKSAEGCEVTAIEKVTQRYGDEFINNKDITLFLGTTLSHHRARHYNPFTITGVFYPPSITQTDLFG